MLNRFGNVAGIVVVPAISTAIASNPPPANYAIKSGYAIAFVQSMPEVCERLKTPYPQERDLAQVAKEAREATALVLVY